MNFCKEGRDPKKGDIIVQIDGRKFYGAFSVLLYVIKAYTQDGKLRIEVSDFLGKIFLLPPCRGHNFAPGKWEIIN